MEYKPMKNLLLLRPDSVEYVYKSINMKTSCDMEGAIKALRDWLEKQSHFKRKDFTDNYLQSAIIASKGSIEGTKQRLDKICTLRTLIPDSFRSFDVKKDFHDCFVYMKPIMLPQLSQDQCRLFVVKPSGIFEASHICDVLKYTLVIGDYMKQTDIICNFKGIFDLSDINLMEVITKLNLMDLRRTLTVYFEGHGMRLKGIYFITTSKVIETLIGLLKQVLKPKIVQRIRVVKSWDELHSVIGKDIIPVDFGGYEKSVQEIHDEWVEELSSDKFKQYLRDINSTGTDESCRSSYKFNEEYAGMPGTFKVLNVD
ncbi:unnamed protein product [Colias eurytheme]|nr:unnamed protein product [Colias eurytheme]